MTILALAILSLSVLGDDPSPAELVRLLGSPDRLEREEAARTLEEVGADALPALRDAEKAAPGEARSRASVLARSIEGKQLERPTLVALDFEARPLDEAIRTLAARSGHKIQLDAGKDAALPRRPITARVPSPIPFWEALDAIGRAGHVRHNPGAHFWEPATAPVLFLADGDPPASTLYRGAFRLHLLGLHRRRDRDLRARPGREPSWRDVLYVDLQAFAEPGRSLDFAGRPRLEAVDDRGRTFPPPPADAEWPDPRRMSWETPGAIGLLQWRVPIGVPGPPDGKTLRSLRGTLPAIVSALRPDPLVIDVHEAQNQPHRHGETTIRVQVVGGTSRQPQIDLILTRDPGPAATRDDRAGLALLRRLHFEGREGRPLPWLRLSEQVGTDRATHLRVMLSDADGPVRLRFHDLAWSAIEIPFAFADVPLP